MALLTSTEAQRDTDKEKHHLPRNIDITAPDDEADIAPQDGGRGAWVFLFGAAIVEISAWGTKFL
jgi:hypothetical protein